MPKAYCYLSQKTIDRLEEIKDDEGYESSSQVMKEMIELGIKVYLHNKDKPELSEEEKYRLLKEEELNKMHSTYLLRLLSLNADILRCVFDKSKFSGENASADELIKSTKIKVDQYIDGYINS